MASPKELIAVIAEQTGVPAATVFVHDRNLAEQGLRTPALRGRGVSHVSFKDAANLLIAVAASRNVKDSAKIVREYSALTARKKMDFETEIRGSTFGDAIEALLEAIPAHRELYTGRGDEDEATVSIYGPEPRAVILIRLPGQKQLTKFQYDGEANESGYVDLKFIAEFSQVTLGHVGDRVSRTDAG